MNFLEFENGEYVYLDTKRITYIGYDECYDKETRDDSSKFEVRHKYSYKYIMIYDGHLIHISPTVYKALRDKLLENNKKN